MGVVLVGLFVSVAHAGMSGDCGAFKTNIQQELKIWKSPAVAADGQTALVTGKKLNFQLKPQASVKFPVAPEKIFNEDNPGFAGVFNFTPVKSGVHQVALGKRAWLDVVEASTMQIVDAGQFEMQTKCDKLVKVMSYDLKAGKSYVLQINSSPTQTLEGTILTN